MMPARSRILLTGAAGFLGRHTAPRLVAAGYQVVAVGRRTAPATEGLFAYHQVDLENPGELKAAISDPGSFSAVVHLAGPAPKGDPGWGEAGIRLVLQHLNMALSLRTAFDGWTGKIVHASGMPVYGVPTRLPILESDARVPWNAYGLAKLLSEDVFLGWPGVDRWVLRMPGLFSSERREGGIFSFMRAASEGEPIRITATRPMPWDLQHVEDAAEAVVRALAAAPGVDPGALNVGYGESVNVLRIAHWIAENIGKGSSVQGVPGVEHPLFQMDIGKAKALFSWPPCSLQDRLLQVAREYGFVKAAP
jgi:nucleoside-diphosphate-sugar epimerase